MAVLKRMMKEEEKKSMINPCGVVAEYAAMSSFTPKQTNIPERRMPALITGQRSIKRFLGAFGEASILLHHQCHSC
jgi:hypothetical protein